MESLEQSIPYGGLKMPNVFLKVKAWQLTWLRRCFSNPESSWLIIINNILESIRLQELVHGSFDKDSSILNKLPPFYRNIMLTWIELKHEYNANDFANELIWFNDNITIDKKHIFWESWYNRGVKYIRDILDGEGNCMSSGYRTKIQYSV